MTPLKIRGLHLDPARRFFGVTQLLQIVELASKCGINTLHLHLSDDQGIAIESNVLNFHSGWTINEQNIIYETCKKLGIDIIPEFDIPGHSVALRSILDNKKYEPEKQMGVVSEGLIKFENIPIILQLYDEIVSRFHPKYFHMGGDETRGTTKEYFQELVDKVCEWGLSKNIKIIAWEDVLGKVDPPNNLIIHKWKKRTYPQIAQKLELLPLDRIIHSENYYLDTCLDIFTAYRTKIKPGILGCIACTWGELIGPENLEQSIFPALYLLGNRWNNPTNIVDPAVSFFCSKT